MDKPNKNYKRKRNVLKMERISRFLSQEFFYEDKTLQFTLAF